MPAFLALFGIIFVIAVAITAGAFVLSVVAMLIAPAVVALIAFLATLPTWLSSALASNSQIRQALRLRVTANGPVWTADGAALHSLQPYGPQFAAAAAAIAAVIVELVIVANTSTKLQHDPVKDFATIGGILALFISPALPFVVAHKFKGSLCEKLKLRLAALVAKRFANETAALARIVGTENQLIEAYRSVGIRVSGDATERCRDSITELVINSQADVRANLQQLQSTVERDLIDLTECIVLFDATLKEFDLGKTAVIENGSTTLLDELDRIKSGLQSESLRSLLTERKWSDFQEILALMMDELQKLKLTAEGLGGLSADREADYLPKSIDEAYQVLNVTKDTDKQVIKKLVGALRQSWHPDAATDKTDKQEQKKRTVKMQQINAAWEWIDGKRS
jgi:DnaJ-domain-containing protein 1